MRGDFSSWRNELGQNFNGVLSQQGRVLLDRDWNAQTQITNDWQDTAGQDIIGAGVAAVPADQPNGFKINRAEIVAGPPQEIHLQIGTGRVWADGLLAQLSGANSADTEAPRTATYLEPPLQSPTPTIPSIPSTVRDAVILELWREEVNGFQQPQTLIEPALGGVDTTERVRTAMAFRLLRLADDETCDSVIDRLRDDFSSKGKLTVTLQPTTATAGDCPVVAGGGYTGFEHNLYRIEIAQVKGGEPAMFKWSQFNGGLVGRGKFDATNKKVTITANVPAIINSGLNQFYLEASRHDAALGHQRVIYGARVTLNSNGELVLPAAGSGDEILGAIPTTGGADTLFFRLWNDIRPISDFTAATELRDGIILQFDAVAAANYLAHDYWAFDVRAGEVPNPSTLIDHQPPAGIHYHRAPLAVVTWDVNPGEIEDCRRIFQPLTRLATCCTHRVGDGMRSHGDFTSIQAAIDHLPAVGGEVCVLPGLYEENVSVVNKRNVTIKGCGARSRVKFKTSGPVIHVRDSQEIRVESLAIQAGASDIGVFLEGPEIGASGERQSLRGVTLESLDIVAARGRAIEAHVGQYITIRDCRVTMLDQPTELASVFLVGDDSLIENNLIQVILRGELNDDGSVTGHTGPGDTFLPAGQGRGGLHLGGGCDRVRVIGNLIRGGVGDGITIGSVIDTDEIDVDFPQFFSPKSWRKTSDDPAMSGKARFAFVGAESVRILAGRKQTAGAALNEIHIERNRIFHMGANGIAVDAFFDLSSFDEMISVKKLTIIGNEIRACMNRPQADIPARMVDSMAYGGIALADVEDLVVRDNLIADNGPDHLQPVCGVFVLHGEGVEISRNRIVNNGARTGQPSAGAKAGRRGGINIVYAIAPQLQLSPSNAASDLGFPVANGVPAAFIHENIVSAPLGQALVLGALGPVSVEGNQFTSLGMAPLQLSPLNAGATVWIFNYGLSNELWYQLLAFANAAKGVNQKSGKPNTPAAPNVAAQTGLDDVRIGQYLANGNVLFRGNQCELNLVDLAQSFALTSVFIGSYDDIGFYNNQCDCDLFFDLIYTQAFLFGMSLRVGDNRFKESLNHAALSAFSYGAIFNSVTNNQSTHCLLIGGDRRIDQGNLALINIVKPGTCGGGGKFAKIVTKYIAASK